MSETKPIWCVIVAMANPEMTETALSDLLAQSIPVRVLLVLQGVDPAFRDRFLQIAEQEPRLLVWSHDPALPSLSATWNRALQAVWGMGGTEALVCNNDVRLHPQTVEYLRVVQQRESAFFTTAVGVTEEQFKATGTKQYTSYDFFDAHSDREDAGYLLHRGGPDFSCFLISKEGHEQYPFDEGFVPAFCVTPDTPVLTTDLRWIPIGDVRVGDELIGVDEHEQPRVKGEYRRRCYRVGKVTETRRRLAPCLKLWLADGRTVTCSTDHKWLTKYPSGAAPYRWRAASELSIGYRIAAPLDTWPAPSTYEDGWLAGIADGEGSLRTKIDNRCEVNIAQKEGMILDEIKRMLDSVRIPFTWRIRPENNVGTVEIGVRRHVLRFLGQFRPKRLLAKMRWEDLSLFSRSVEMGIAITGIQPVGEQEVVTIETTTHTYLANGMIAHNCEDLDSHRRYMLGGDGDKIFSINLPYLHIGGGSQTLKSMDPEARARRERLIDGARAYYTRKWGGGVNQEKFTIPFEEKSAQDGVTTPELQRAIQEPADVPAN